MAMNAKPEWIVVTGKSNPEKTELAKTLRRTMTPAEKVLWQELRGNKLQGLHFRRQQTISGFVADFYCHKVALAVEVDGAGHDAVYDEERDRAFAERGIKVLRFTNQEVLNQTELVLEKIVQHLKVS